MTQVVYFVAAIRRSLLLEIGVDATAEQVALSSPSYNHVKGAMARLAASCSLKNRDKVQKAQFAALSCNKSHKDGVSHFVK